MDILAIIGSPGVSALVGALIGAAASIVTTCINNARENRRIEERRRDERDQRLRSFEAETYLELQVSLQHMVRLTMEACLQIARQYDKGTSVGDIRIDGKLDMELLSSHQELMRLEQRVMDEGLRQQLGSLRKLSNNVTAYFQDSASAWASMKSLSDGYGEANDVIGARLRASIQGCEV